MTLTKEIIQGSLRCTHSSADQLHDLVGQHILLLIKAEKHLLKALCAVQSTDLRIIRPVTRPTRVKHWLWFR